MDVTENSIDKGQSETKELRLYRFKKEGEGDHYAHVLDVSEEAAKKRLTPKVSNPKKLICVASAGLNELKPCILQNDLLPF